MEKIHGVALLACMAVLLCMHRHAEGAITCTQLHFSVMPCLPYIIGRNNTFPECCCYAVKMIESAIAATKADRRAVCRCLKAAVSNGMDVGKANKIIYQCGVSLPYKISNNSTDCHMIH